MNRGGSWNNNPRNVRSANRNRNSPNNRNNNLGFRLVLQCTGNGFSRWPGRDPATAFWAVAKSTSLPGLVGREPEKQVRRFRQGF